MTPATGGTRRPCLRRGLGRQAKSLVAAIHACVLKRCTSACKHELPVQDVRRNKPAPCLTRGIFVHRPLGFPTDFGQVSSEIVFLYGEFEPVCKLSKVVVSIHDVIGDGNCIEPRLPEEVNRLPQIHGTVGIGCVNVKVAQKHYEYFAIVMLRNYVKEVKIELTIGLLFQYNSDRYSIPLRTPLEETVSQ